MPTAPSLAGASWWTVTARPYPWAHRHQWRFVLERREAFAEPISHRGQPSLFYVRREVVKWLPPRYEYRIEGLDAGAVHPIPRRR
jgi:hypothetical protein